MERTIKISKGTEIFNKLEAALGTIANHNDVTNITKIAVDLNKDESLINFKQDEQNLADPTTNSNPGESDLLLENTTDLADSTDTDTEIDDTQDLFGDLVPQEFTADDLKQLFLSQQG